jgi:hypothetical protein
MYFTATIGESNQKVYFCVNSYVDLYDDNLLITATIDSNVSSLTFVDVKISDLSNIELEVL